VDSRARAGVVGEIESGINSRRVRSDCRDFPRTGVDLQAEAAADADHLIGADGRSPDSKYGIALLEQARRDGVENFIECSVSNSLGTCKVDQREGEPFAQNRGMSGTKDEQRVGLHLSDVLFDQGRVIVRTRTIWPGNQNHHSFVLARRQMGPLPVGCWPDGTTGATANRIDVPPRVLDS